MEILLLLLMVQLLKLSVPFHLRGGRRGTGRGRRRVGDTGRVEAGPRRRRLRLRLGGRRGGRGGGSAGRGLRRTLLDVVVLAQDPVVVQVKSVADAEPSTQRNRVTSLSIQSINQLDL